MEIRVTVFLDVEGKIKDKIEELPTESRLDILETVIQGVVKTALDNHFESQENIKAGFVKADLVPQS